MINKGIKIFQYYTLTKIIDLFIIVLIAYLHVLINTKIFNGNYNLSIIILYIVCGIIVLLCFISNIFFPSLSYLICGIRYKKTKKYRIFIENIITYSLLLSFIFLDLLNKFNIISNIIALVLIVDAITCFIPKINTRLILYILKLDIYEYRKEVNEKREIEKQKKDESKIQI